LDKIPKIKIIIKNYNIHAEIVLGPIIEKIESHYIADIPNAFWAREQYFFDLPYDENFKGGPHLDVAIPMSTEEKKICKEEIQYLLDINLIEKNVSP
jgi:hypothetical protein